MSVAHHKLVDVIRSRRRTIVNTDPADYETLDLLPAAGASTEAQVEQTLERERIMRALATIPESQKEVIMLAYFEGFSQSEMAQRLDQPLGTIKTRVRAAMKKLRPYWKAMATNNQNSDPHGPHDSGHPEDMLEAFALDVEEELSVQDHLDGCDQCSDVVDQFQGTASELAGSVQLQDPPADLRARVMQAVS